MPATEPFLLSGLMQETAKLNGDILTYRGGHRRTFSTDLIHSSPPYKEKHAQLASSSTSNDSDGSRNNLHRRSASSGGELFYSPLNVVDKAEELMLELWKRGWRVVHYTSLPDWLRDNDFLHWGHRPQLPNFQACFGSIFRIHTETGNIWTHLIGFACFLILCISFLVQPGLNIPWQEKAIICIFFVSAILALGFSWTFHTVYCHSEPVRGLFSKLDYIGIALLTIGSFVPWLYYSFYCHGPPKIVYLSSIIILGLITIIISSQDKFSTPKYRSIRAGLYIALGLSGVIPCVHYIFLEGFWDTVGSPEVGWLFLMAFLYISGAIIYALRIPESLYPGKFDIWFQSHQIFHVFVVLAALVHLNSILQIAQTRLSTECRVP